MANRLTMCLRLASDSWAILLHLPLVCWAILLHLLLVCWDYRHEPPLLSQSVLIINYVIAAVRANKGDLKL